MSNSYLRCAHSVKRCVHASGVTVQSSATRRQLIGSVVGIALGASSLILPGGNRLVAAAAGLSEAEKVCALCRRCMMMLGMHIAEAASPTNCKLHSHRSNAWCS